MKLTKEKRERLADICEIMLDLAEAQREAGIKDPVALINFNSKEIYYRNGAFKEARFIFRDLFRCDISKLSEEMWADFIENQRKNKEADEIRAKISSLEEKVKAIYK